MEKQIQDLLDKKVIEPCTEHNSINNPLWLVPKKKDSNNIPQYRLVADFRKLNEITRDIAYPMADISNLLETIKPALFYTHSTTQRRPPQNILLKPQP